MHRRRTIWIHAICFICLIGIFQSGSAEDFTMETLVLGIPNNTKKPEKSDIAAINEIMVRHFPF